jgi:hypothetical protein
MADRQLPSKPVTGMQATRGDEQSGSVRTLRRVMLARTTILSPVWSHAKVEFAIVAPIAATALLVSALVKLTAPRSSNTVTLALLASGSAVVLLVWIKAVAVPLVTKGKLPDGRYLADVLARQRMRRQRTRDRRQALRHLRNLPRQPSGGTRHKGLHRPSAGLCWPLRPSMRDSRGCRRSAPPTIRLHIAPALGKYPLKRLSVPIVRSFLNSKIRAGRSVRNVQIMRQVLGAALREPEAAATCR